MVMIMWLGLLIPFFGTTLGSAVVFFIKKTHLIKQDIDIINVK